MQEIGINVFANAKVIKYIEIPASVTEITDVFYFTASNNPDVERVVELLDELVTVKKK